jgi:hypothetical protein
MVKYGLYEAIHFPNVRLHFGKYSRLRLRTFKTYKFSKSCTSL